MQSYNNNQNKQKQKQSNYQALQLDNFYKGVFQQFKQRLMHNYKYKNIPSEQLDKFTKVVQQKLKKSKKRQLFNHGLQLALDKQQTYQNLQRQVKIEEQEEQYNFNVGANLDRKQSEKKIGAKQKNKENKDNQQEQQSQEESEQDDLNKFKKPSIHSSGKKQNQPLSSQFNNPHNNNNKSSSEKVKNQQKIQAKQEPDQQQIQQQQQRIKQQIIKNRQDIIHAHILATYSTKTKRYIAKDQKTKIDLENVFVRTSDKQYFLNKITCDLNQQQITNIKY